MKIEKSEEVLKFGSYSHDGSITVHYLAKDNMSRHLPEFAVTTTGKMAILPSSWLSQMGYELRIHPYERGFSIINDSDGTAIYEDIPYTDGFHYVPRDLLRSLQPTSVSQINFIEQVEEELDKINASQDQSTHKTCNATRRQRKNLPQEMVRKIREAHTKTGHQNPRQAAETIVRHAREDITPYKGEDLITVMDRWPCIFCKAAAQRRGSTNVGSGVKPSIAGAEWSMDAKMGYTEAYH